MSKRQAFRITDLSGGLNPDSNPILIADNEATETRNIRFDQMGSVVSRRGYSRYLDEEHADTHLSLGRWLPEGTITGGKVISHTDAGELVEVAAGYPVLWTGLMTTGGGQFVPVGDDLYFVDGSDTPVVYDGTVVHEVGMDAPGTQPTLAEVIGGTLNFAVTYAYTFYDSTHGLESNPSPTNSITPNPAGRTVRLSALPGTHPRADKIRIYRNLSGGTVLNRLVELPIATTTYDDTGAVTPNALLPAEYDNDPPPALEHLAFSKGYMFGSLGNTLYWSKPYEFESWPALNFTEVPFEGNDSIQGIVAHQDTLIVFGRRNIVLVAGAGGNWSLSRLDVDSGMVSREAAHEIDGQLVYLDYDGLKALPGPQRIAPKLDRLFAGLSPAVMETATLLHVAEERAVWISVPGEGTYTVHLPNRAISWYDLESPGWLDEGANSVGFPLFIDTTAPGYVNQYGAPTDLGTDIPILWRSKVFQLTNPELVKFFRRIGAFASIGSAGVVTITISDSGTSTTVDLVSTSSAVGGVWGTAVWGTDVWAAEGVAYFIAALPAHTLFGHTMQVSISAAVSDTTEVVSPITFEFREANRFLGQ